MSASARLGVDSVIALSMLPALERSISPVTRATATRSWSEK
jgi:hypothetical protein